MTDATHNTARSASITFGQFLPWLVSALFLLVMPLIFPSNAALTIMNQMAITIVFALAYNMLLGQGGMLSFGHAVYMGMGGFMAMHIMNWIEFHELPIPLPVLPLLAGLFALGLAMIIGSFSTRKAGTVFAMISLGVGELIAACSVIIVAFFGGEEGVSGDRTYGLPFFGIEFIRQIEVYYLTAAWLMISAVLMYLWSRTPLGRMANAVRDNPERAEFLGYSARWVRFYSFCASGFFAGIAGGLFAINYEIVTEENLNLAQSGMILLVTFLGGAGFFRPDHRRDPVHPAADGAEPADRDLAALSRHPVRGDGDVFPRRAGGSSDDAHDPPAVGQAAPAVRALSQDAGAGASVRGGVRRGVRDRFSHPQCRTRRYRNDPVLDHLRQP
ncbi:branched-chain amino acid ABC transporter permease [Jhaorihella thermophila]|uniref:branched-chain amino acid ABC transporter permease n=1 Tax=Jhaorihella thermophila TaxID=488547 RepID=UPI0036210081